MTRFLLDTNVISNVTKPIPSNALLAWMVDQNDDDLGQKPCRARRQAEALKGLDEEHGLFRRQGGALDKET